MTHGVGKDTGGRGTREYSNDMNCPRRNHLARPRPGPNPQAVGSSARMPQAKQPTWQEHRDEDEAREYQKNICFIDYTKAVTVWITTNCKILQEMGIPGHLTRLLRNLCAGQEATVRTRHGTTDSFQIGKGVHQGCILSPCLFNLYAEFIM